MKYYVETLIPACHDEYTLTNEEKRSYLPGWISNSTSLNGSTPVERAFMYRTSDQLNTYIFFGQYAAYSSGGYVYEFRGPLSQIRSELSELHQLAWIDNRTRAVIIQMNLYNPNVPIFTSAVLIVELLSSSGLFPTTRFEPLDFSGIHLII